MEEDDDYPSFHPVIRGVFTPTTSKRYRCVGVAYTLVDGSKMVRCSKGDGREMEGATNMAKNLLVCRILCTFAIDCGLCSFI